MYLLDTNIVSEMFRPRPHGGVIAWLNSLGEDTLAISAVTLGEMQRGAELMRLKDAARADLIEFWVDRARKTYTTFPMDADAFVLWAKLIARRDDKLTLDAMIAATAITRRLTVATRNVRDFKALGAKTFNPFDYHA
ncbi:MAG: type II toxin-antitoxin system VapC family toxin [Rhodospirillaceae bacterium]|nr:type II toxin-antitoxin system VapC family toxin [Rhodospirillaceae bacterium]